MLNIIFGDSKLAHEANKKISSKKYRTKQGFATAPIFALAFVAAVGIGTALVSTGRNFANFQNVAKQASNWDTAALATATHISKISSNFLHELQRSYNQSLDNSYNKQVCVTNKVWVPNARVANSNDAVRSDSPIMARGRRGGRRGGRGSRGGRGGGRGGNSGGGNSGGGGIISIPLPGAGGTGGISTPTPPTAPAAPTQPSGRWEDRTTCHFEPVVDGDNLTQAGDEQTRLNNIEARRQIVDNFINELRNINGYGSKLKQTASYGLTQGKEEHDNSSLVLSLLKSNLIKPIINNRDPNNKRFASTLISNATEINATNLAALFLSGSNIFMDATLLRYMIQDNPRSNFMDSYRSYYGAMNPPSFNHGIRAENLPNAIKLSFLTRKKDKNNPNDKQIAVIKQAAGQIRIEENNVNPVCHDGTTPKADGSCPSYCEQNPDSCKPDTNIDPLCSDGTPPPCNVCPVGLIMLEGRCQVPGTTQINLTGLIDGEYRVMVRDPNAPISADNPLIIWRPGGNQLGNYIALYPDANGDLFYEHGTGLSRRELRNAGFTDQTDTGFVPTIITTNSTTESNEITIKTPSHGVTRMTKIDQGGTINGITIPPGSVFMPITNEPAGSRSRFGSINEFSTFYVYDAEGNLIGEFTRNQIKNADFGDVNLGKEIVRGVNANADPGGNDGIIPGANALSRPDPGELFNSPGAFAKAINHRANEVIDGINNGNEGYGAEMRDDYGEQRPNAIPPEGSGLRQDDPIFHEIQSHKVAMGNEYVTNFEAIQALTDGQTMPPEVADDPDLRRYLELVLREARGQLSHRQRQEMNNLEDNLMTRYPEMFTQVQALRTSQNAYLNAQADEFAYLNSGQIPCRISNEPGCRETENDPQV